jgi:hypothetical protein
MVKNLAQPDIYFARLTMRHQPYLEMCARALWKSRREFDATKDFGKLLGLTLQLLDGPVRRLH